MTTEKMSAEALIEQYQSTRDAALLDQLTRRHLYIADIVARRYSGRGVEYDDLYQVASLALVKAIMRFNADKGVKFVSFATPTMMGEVKNYFRDKSRIITLPRRENEMGKRLERARMEFENARMRAPTPTELAEAMDVPLDTVLEILEMRNAATITSIDTVPIDSEDSPLSAFIGIEEEGYRAFENRDQLERALTQLPENEREVLVKRFSEGLSQRQIAQTLDISQMTVSRLERKALARIRILMGHEEE